MQIVPLIQQKRSPRFSFGTVSVIVPVYNVAPYLVRCVKSILSQTYRSLEVILVDDGSDDGSGELCEALADTDPRIRVVHRANGGLSAARNAGLAVLTGEWILFVDSDDYIDRTMVEDLLHAAKASKADLVLTGIRCVSEHDVLYKEDCMLDCTWSEDDFWRHLYPETTCRSISAACFAVSWNKLYKRKLFAGIGFDVGKVHEDEFILHKIISRCHIIKTTSYCHYNYLQRFDSITNRKPDISMQLDAAEAYSDRAEYLIANGYIHEARMALGQCVGSLSVAFVLGCGAKRDFRWSQIMTAASNSLRKIQVRGRPSKTLLKLCLFRISPRLACYLLGKYFLWEK